MKTFALLAAAGSLAAIGAPAAAADFAPPTPAAATFSGFSAEIAPASNFERDPPPHARAWGRRGRDWDDRRWDDDRWDDDDDWRERRWRERDRWDGRRLGRRDRIWRGRDGRFRCRRDDGTVGLVIGAGVGALLGREIDRRGDRTLGTVLGAVAGGLLGREIDRGDVRCR